VSEILLLLTLLLLLWFWVDSMRARERALVHARRACAEQDVQLLDETVALTRLRAGRDAMGRMAWRRHYRFEFSVEGDARSRGELILLGSQLLGLQMEMEPA